MTWLKLGNSKAEGLPLIQPTLNVAIATSGLTLCQSPPSLIAGLFLALSGGLLWFIAWHRGRPGQGFLYRITTDRISGDGLNGRLRLRSLPPQRERRSHTPRARSRSRRVRRLAGEEQALFERTRQVLPRRRMARKRMTRGSADTGHSAPVRRDKRTEVAARARSEQAGKLINRVRKACGRTRLLHHLSPFVAHEALDHGPTEWTDKVDPGAAVTRIPNHPRLGGERNLADDLQEQLLSRPSGREAAA